MSFLMNKEFAGFQTKTRIEIAIRNRICFDCEKKIKPGESCARFQMAQARSICIPCFYESCVVILKPESFSTEFKAAIMARKI